jgi:hypothetical protein
MGHIAVLMQHDKIIQELVKKGAAVALLRRNTFLLRCNTLYYVAPRCSTLQQARGSTRRTRWGSPRCTSQR